MKVYDDKELFEIILRHILENTQEIGNIRNKCSIFEKLNNRVDDLEDKFHDHEVKNAEKLTEMKEKISGRATLIAVLSSIGTIIAALLIAYFSRK